MIVSQSLRGLKHSFTNKAFQEFDHLHKLFIIDRSSYLPHVTSLMRTFYRTALVVSKYIIDDLLLINKSLHTLNQNIKRKLTSS